MIDEIPVLTDVQKKFYKTMLEQRLENILIPTYNKITESGRKTEDKGMM